MFIKFLTNSKKINNTKNKSNCYLKIKFLTKTILKKSASPAETGDSQRMQ